jgi:molecular chaperone GrpE (heat shock protein)/DNA-binding Xre family transcriptional regulator
MASSSYTKNRQHLKYLMQLVGITSLQELSHLSGISEWQLIRIEYGLMPKMPVEILLKLSQALKISVNDLLTQFCPHELLAQITPPTPTENHQELETLKQDYQHLQSQINHERASFAQEFQRLQAQMEQQKQTLIQEFQSSSLQQLESWLIQWPTAAAAAQKNPQLPAFKLLPLIKPVAGLLKQWGVEAIASVGEQVAYDPQSHQLMEGSAQAGDLVRVRYVGYRQGDKLLHRAKVSPVAVVNSSLISKTEANHNLIL